MQIEPNIFDFAYGELSQDAFLEYFLTFGKKEYTNSRVFETVQDFLKQCGIPKGEVVQEIKRQFHHIDVFVRTNNYYLIIEDKTGTSEHNDQIYEYYKELNEEEKFESSKIRICYFKTMDFLRDYCPPTKEEDTNITLDKNQCFTFNRERILDLFEPIKDENLIFQSYYQHLTKYDSRGNYQNKSIVDWNKECWFKFLEPYLKKKKDSGIGYVPNFSGGFYGAWFDYSENKKTNTNNGEVKYWNYKQIEIYIRDNKTTKIRFCRKIGTTWNKKNDEKCPTNLINKEIDELQEKQKAYNNYYITKKKRNGETSTYLCFDLVDNPKRKKQLSINGLTENEIREITQKFFDENK